TRVVAVYDDPLGDHVRADTGLEIYIRGTRTDGAVPADAAQQFAAAQDDPTLAPVIAYPADGIVVPPNLGALDVHWRDNHNHDLFEVSPHTHYIDYVIYKSGLATAFVSYTPDEWLALANTHEHITLAVSAMASTTPTKKSTAAP